MEFSSVLRRIRKYLLLTGIFLPLGIFAQTITGIVVNERSESLIGANVYWLNTTIGVTSDDDGAFSISPDNISDLRLVASYVGHTSDTIDIKDQNYITFSLLESKTLNEVVVRGQKDGIVISSLSAIKTEKITQTELVKAACCDLAGCFETQSSVQSHTTNVLTNSKELRILGLSGYYNQVLIDGFPMIQGLSYTYGVSSIPGTLVDNIYVAKGANSVLQGYESISGQTNVETKDPDNTDKLLLNGYINSFAEKHLNANITFKKDGWSNITAIHTVQPADKTDGDKDGFLDLPLLTRYMIFHKWKYGNDIDWGWSSRIGVRFLNEKRIGGQVSFNPDLDQGSTSVYGQTVRINQPEIWTKTGFRLNDVHNIIFFASAYYHDQESYFGPIHYQADQVSLYGNLQYELNYGRHTVKSGFSLRHLNLKEQVAFTENTLLRTYDGHYQRYEIVPGFFLENTMRFLEDRITWIAAFRADRHNQFGVKLAPRTLLKYDITPQSILRANIGKGWRTVNIFSENNNLLVSSRDIIFEEALLPEEAINYGINLTQKFETKDITGHISTDFYRTHFQNKIFPDYDADPTKAIVKNFNGTSIANGFQSEFYLRLHQQYEFKLGYNYLDVYRQQGDARQVLPFNAKHRVLTTFSYKPLSNKYHIDISANWNGQKRMPDTQTNPIEFQRPDFSEAYTVINAQFTYNFENTEIYLGAENIFDMRQERPIIGWQNPFSQYFDTSSVWGPTRGRELYIGVRYYVRNED